MVVSLVGWMAEMRVDVKVEKMVAKSAYSAVQLESYWACGWVLQLADVKVERLVVEKACL